MHVAELTLYPVKSGRGVPVQSAEVEARGLVGDRRWVIADAKDRFVTQREVPQLSRMRAELTGSAASPGLRLSYEVTSLQVAVPGPEAPRHMIRVWNDVLPLSEVPEAAPWLAQCFGRELRLFYQSDQARRPVDDWGHDGDHVSLADGYPLLIANAQSLKALSAQAGTAIGMERFRPNLVIEGAEAWEEDSWHRLRVGSLEIDLVKPCARCTMTSVDQELGEVAGVDPLTTLRRVRMSADRRVPGVLFGWNAVPRSTGIVRVGDEVTVLESGHSWPLMPERDLASRRA